MNRKKLIESAIECRKKAYAPYSGFKVGAAVEGESGKIYAGCNIENSSYGLTICAERAAVARAVAEGERKINSVAVVTSSKELSLPCGACRQVINEFGKKARIICADEKGEFDTYRADEILPYYGEKNSFKENLSRIRKEKED